MIRLRKILLCDYLYLILLGLTFGYVLISINIEKKSLYQNNEKIFKGYIEKIKIDGNQLTINLKAKEEIIINYYFLTPKEKESFSLKLGDYIKVEGTLQEPSSSRIPNLFDYKKYLMNNNIFYLLKVDKIKLLRKNTNQLLKLKQFLIDVNNTNSLSSAYINALVLGNKKLITQEVTESYQINGVSHLFAISGLHVSFLSLILLFLLKNISEIKRYFIVSVFLLFYAFITDFSASIMRAVIFFIGLKINQIFYFYIKPINILILTLSFLLIINSFYIFDVGFQFSFIICFFLLKFQKQLTNKKGIKLFFWVSIVSFLASLPICYQNFFQINLLAPLLNVVFVPFLSFIIYPLCLLTLFLPFLSIILNILLSILETLSLMFSSLSFNLILSKTNIIIVFVYYFIIYKTIKTLFQRKYLWLIILSFVLIIHHNISYFDSSLKIYFIDVGQGDSILIKLPNQKGNVLIDTGGKLNYQEDWQRKNKSFSLAKNNLIPFFKSLGITKIDSLIITHGDADHIGESIDLVNNFKVENVVFNCGEYNDLEKNLIKVLKKNKINYYSCIKELNIDKYKLQFLNTKEYQNENDNSNVIYFNYNKYKFLFMGDAGLEREKDILEKYNLKDIDFLKVGHHGSNTSSNKLFIDRINPKYSLISVGKNNRYGHPKDEVLNTLKNSKIYRTDLDGSIEIRLNKRGYKIRTCPP